MKEIRLAGNYTHLIALVDDEDYEKVIPFQWFYNQGYASANRDYKQVSMHRFVLSSHGPLTKGWVVDHINGNRLDNQKANLRLVLKGHNSYNKSKKRGNLGFKNVRKDRKKFSAYITVNRKWRFIGNFDTEREAAIAYDLTAKAAFGQLAKINLPEASPKEIEAVATKLRAKP